jgi:hypothetical protein
MHRLSSCSSSAFAYAGRAFALLSISIGIGGCATVAQVTNLSAEACADQMRVGLSEILVEQGEKPDAGDALARQTLSALTGSALGPRPFLIAAPSGTDYEFFVQKKRDACLLRMLGRRHGFVTYTNNLTYIATRPLERCECAE